MTTEAATRQDLLERAVAFIIKAKADREDIPSTEVFKPLAYELDVTFDDARNLVYEAVEANLVRITPSYTLQPIDADGNVITEYRVPPRVAASWDDTFMRMALLVANRSKDPSTQVGACIVSAENRILSLGYNGTPNGWADDEFPWDKVADDPLDTKYPYVIHAERNAVLNYGGLHTQLRGAKVYVTHFPCNECAKELAQVGVAEVIYLNSHDSSDFSTKASLRILESCGIEVTQIELS